MKKIFTCLLFIASVTAVSAQTGMGFYVMPGYNIRTAEYSVSPGTSYNLSSFSIDIGMSFRYPAANFISIEIAGGIMTYMGLSNALSEIDTVFEPSGVYYEEEDIYSMYGSGDIIFNIIPTPINLFAGIKWNGSGNELIHFLEGGLFVRYGLEIIIVSPHAIRITGEVRLPLNDTYDTEYDGQITISNALNFQISYIGQLDL